MSEYKPITYKIRERMEQAERIIPIMDGAQYTQVRINLAWLTERLDEIDSVHAALEAEREKAKIRAGQLLDDAEKERDYNYANWQECKQKVLQGNITIGELNAKIEHLMDELSHCIELPKDADNVPWNVCDCDEDGNEVTELRLTPSGWFVLTDDEWPYRPERHRHYHAPTVEDVLREFADEVYADADNEIRDRDFLCAKYAKRLTLAGEDE